MIASQQCVSKTRGVRRRCLNCTLPFYDLARTPIICPNCSEPFELEAPIPSTPIERSPSARYPSAHGVGGWASRARLAKPSDVLAADARTTPEQDAIDVDQKTTVTGDETGDDLLLEAEAEIEDDVIPEVESDHSD